MKPMRSILFVPGHRESWPAKAVAAGADGVILDLEDAVPQNLKAEAREITAGSIRALAAGSRKVGVYVRLNALETGMTGDDLERVAIPGLSGVRAAEELRPARHHCLRRADHALRAAQRRHAGHDRDRRLARDRAGLRVVRADRWQRRRASRRCSRARPRTPTSRARSASSSRRAGMETLYLRSRAVSGGARGRPAVPDRRPVAGPARPRGRARFADAEPPARLHRAGADPSLARRGRQRDLHAVGAGGRLLRRA